MIDKFIKLKHPKNTASPSLNLTLKNYSKNNELLTSKIEDTLYRRRNLLDDLEQHDKKV